MVLGDHNHEQDQTTVVARVENATRFRLRPSGNKRPGTLDAVPNSNTAEILRQNSMSQPLANRS